MARKKFFLPRRDDEISLWLKNFSSKISGYAAKYNLTADEVTKVQKGAAYLVYWINAAAQMKAAAQQVTAYKNEVRNGVATDGAQGQQPATITFSPPDNPGPGVVPFVLSIAGRIKKHQGYTQGDGADLGLEGTEQHTDLQKLKPVFTVELHGGYPKLIWKKGLTSGIKIKVNRNYKPLDFSNTENGFEFLAIDTQPDYLDTHALPPFGQSAVWAYVMIYIVGDEEVGNWSEPVMITVSGKL